MPGDIDVMKMGIIYHLVYFFIIYVAKLTFDINSHIAFIVLSNFCFKMRVYVCNLMLILVMACETSPKKKQVSGYYDFVLL